MNTPIKTKSMCFTVKLDADQVGLKAEGEVALNLVNHAGEELFAILKIDQLREILKQLE